MTKLVLISALLASIWDPSDAVLCYNCETAGDKYVIYHTRNCDDTIYCPERCQVVRIHGLNGANEFAYYEDFFIHQSCYNAALQPPDNPPGRCNASASIAKWNLMFTTVNDTEVSCVSCSTDLCNSYDNAGISWLGSRGSLAFLLAAVLRL